MHGVNASHFDDLPEETLPEPLMYRIAAGALSTSELEQVSDAGLCNGVTLLLSIPGCMTFRTPINRLVCWYTGDCDSRDALQLTHELERLLTTGGVLPHQQAVLQELIRRFRAKLGY